MVHLLTYDEPDAHRCSAPDRRHSIRYESSDSLPILPDEVVESAHAVKGPASREDAHLEYLAAARSFNVGPSRSRSFRSLTKLILEPSARRTIQGLYQLTSACFFYRTTLAPRRLWI